jgi:hypothetical protein
MSARALWGEVVPMKKVAPIDRYTKRREAREAGRDIAPHGIPMKVWDAAKEEALNAMRDRAAVRGMIPYSDLVKSIKNFKFGAHDIRLFDLLGEISMDEAEAGRGMLSVVVVHKHGDMQPGPGFFKFAEELGIKSTRDQLKFWIDELNKVHHYWSVQRKAKAKSA